MKETFDFYNSTSIKSYNLDERIRYQLKMLDGLDNFTRKHTDNVANITCRLCEKLNMTKGFTVYCTTCAYLHDIGKMFIPPSVLQKPGKLTDQEFEIMKTHTVQGAQLLEKISQLRKSSSFRYAYDIARHHHERWDGSGYPDGLKGDEISIWAQIVSLADVYDALRCRRVYKEAFSREKTLDMIRSGQCGSFNPELLECFFAVEDQLNEI